MLHLNNSGNWAVDSLESWRGGEELENDWDLKYDDKWENNEELENDEERRTVEAVYFFRE